MVFELPLMTRKGVCHLHEQELEHGGNEGTPGGSEGHLVRGYFEQSQLETLPETMVDGD